eukprot:1924042-Prymnesium_polylepis.1
MATVAAATATVAMTMAATVAMAMAATAATVAARCNPILAAMAVGATWEALGGEMPVAALAGTLETRRGRDSAIGCGAPCVRHTAVGDNGRRRRPPS